MAAGRLNLKWLPLTRDWAFAVRGLMNDSNEDCEYKVRTGMDMSECPCMLRMYDG